MNDHERHRVAAEAETARFIELAGEADLATPISTCPGWTLADLLRHLGTVHRWMTHIVLTRPDRRIPAGDLRLDLPAETDAYRDWFAAGVAPLTAALRATGGDEPVWTPGADQRMRVWPWRLLCETLVHRADVELALGRRPVITREAAADGIEEFLTTVLYYDRIVERLREFGHAGETIHLHATDGRAEGDGEDDVEDDVEGEWIATLGADGRTARERGHAKSTVAVRGTVADLLLLLWGRYPLGERFTVFGDEELLSGFLAAVAV